MFRSYSTLRFVAACGLLAFVTAPAGAIPGVKGGGHHRQGNKKQTGPLDAAIKDLKEAEKGLGSKEGTGAGKLTKSAEQIVSDQLKLARQARDRAADSGTATKEQRDQLKARITALDGVVKDIKTAVKEIAAKKTEDAKTALQSAISGLERLTGGEKKK